jgi:hypothetical protein
MVLKLRGSLGYSFSWNSALYGCLGSFFSSFCRFYFLAGFSTAQTSHLSPPSEACEVTYVPEVTPGYRKGD